MQSNKPQTAYADMVKGMLPFETGEYPFNRRALSVESLPFRTSHSWRVLRSQPLVRSVRINDWYGSVLALDQIEQCPIRVTLVSHNELWVELALSDIPRITEDTLCTLGIVDIACANIYGNRQFGFTIDQQMQFPAVCCLALAICALLYRPTSLSVHSLAVSTVCPAFECGGIQSNALTERWQAYVVLSHQLARNFYDHRVGMVLCKPIEESAESGFVRYLGHIVDSADLSDCRAGLQSPDQCGGGRYAQNEPRENATPEDFDGIAFGSAPNLSRESAQKWRIIDIAKYPFQLENGLRFANANNGVMMVVCHRKVHTFLWLEGVGVGSFGALAFLLTCYAQIIAKSPSFFKLFRHEFSTSFTNNQA